MTPFRPIDALLNRVTMYRLVVYGLVGLLAVAALFALAGQLSLRLWGLVASLGVLVWACWLTNRALAAVWKAPANTESWLITALILCCILPPATTVRAALAAAAAGIIAMASKYVLAVRRKHIFNPAALAAAAVGLLGIAHATWWIAAPVMLPFTLILGLLVVRKLRQFQLGFAFGIAALMVLTALGLRHGHELHIILKQAFTSWPLVFFGSIMLTEPATLPPTRDRRLLYGAFAGVLFASQLRAGPISTTPEIALLIANIFAYAVSPKYNLQLRFKQKRELAPHIYEFIFAPDRQPRFTPGQYMEWTLPHLRPDSRGNRRTFTIASSPTRPDIRIGVRFSHHATSFKRALLALQPDDTVMAGHIAGNFVLPADPNAKLAFIAGGIGITPFVSMLEYLIDTKQRRDIILFYVVRNAQDVAYRHLLAQAEHFGVRVIVLGPGMLTPKLIADKAPDYQGRTFYLAGANSRAHANRRMLLHMHVPPHHILADHFSGY